MSFGLGLERRRRDVQMLAGVRVIRDEMVPQGSIVRIGEDLYMCGVTWRAAKYRIAVPRETRGEADRWADDGGPL